MNWTIKYKLVDRNPLVSNYYYGHYYVWLYQYWHPQKRGTRTDSRTPSLDDGGLVHFSGPRLIGYDQLPLSPIVVTPTKVFLQNRHPLSSSSIYSNIEQGANQKSQSSRWHLTWTLNFVWQECHRTQCHKLFSTPRWWLEVACFNSLLRCEEERLILRARSRYPSQGSDSWQSEACYEGYSTNHHKWHHMIRTDTNTYPNSDASYTIVIFQTNLWTIPKPHMQSLRTIKTTMISFNTIVPSDFLATPILITLEHFPTFTTL